ncbi:UNVERIFIED_CONTAM: hypothetical protein GTU68_012809 [Idotea baltica]|nr:hypothetical protein [Idotea baltica]
MSLPFFQIDAFTSEPFGGNPAAVVLLKSEQSDSWLQSVAMENNLSETAFVLPQNDDEESTVRNLAIDFRRLAEIDARGAIITAVADTTSNYDFVSRFFAPAAGVDEDPVTGSAHCALIDYWSRKLNRNALTGYQASARGGMVEIEKQNDRALLTGEAVTVVQGEWKSPN